MDSSHPLLLAAAREALGPDRVGRAETLPEDALYLWVGATLLYGDLWQRQLARDLAVDDRLVRRWATGDRPVPQRVLERLAVELNAHHEATEVGIRLLLDRLGQPAAAG